MPSQTIQIKRDYFPDSNVHSIHLLVSLCDNKYQGIVPVSAKTGNGQDPENNLYWGWGYGIRTYFKKSPEWQFIRSEKYKDSIPERLIFLNKTKKIYLIADAYDGRYIRSCTIDFVQSLSGTKKDTLHVNGDTIGLYGNARTLAYIGHNGFMDFDLPESYGEPDGRKRDCFILACMSKKYFESSVRKAGANPILWTTNFMGPEAYTLHDALTGYVNKENAESIRLRAAKAYSKYAKCTVAAAKNLLVTGW